MTFCTCTKSCSLIYLILQFIYYVLKTNIEPIDTRLQGHKGPIVPIRFYYFVKLYM